MGMDRLIPVTNQIRDAVASVQLEIGVDLPQIAVVGGQSVGKSSLLEGIVGRAFLPTGNGICTRRPLLLRLTHARGGSAEWGEFQHLPGQRFDGFDEIRDEIARETERACGQKQVVLSTPIVLTICSPNVIDLTLIDLPGITHVPVGDQPPDIERQIRELVIEHIKSPRCLILAVVAGNADLATADALSVAREVDPEGERTIGVVTKLDIVDHGVDMLAVLEGRVYPLRQGFVGVVQRSFRDVQNGKDVGSHLTAEAQFFDSHPSYRAVAHQCGVSYLAKRLNKVLMEHICAVLPDIKIHALQLIHENEVELQGYGDSVSGNSLSEQGALLLSLISKFASRFADAIDGKVSSQRGDFSGPEGQLVGRARIDFIFRDVFSRTVREFDCFSGLGDDEIRVAIRNATGPRASLFVPEAAFELLARKQITKLLSPSLQCVELVFEELQRVLLLSELPEFRRFANLREKIFAVVRDILRQRLEPTSQMVRDLIDIELAYINTNHPSFIGGTGALRNASKPGIVSAPTASSVAPPAATARAETAPPPEVPAGGSVASPESQGLLRRALAFFGSGEAKLQQRQISEGDVRSLADLQSPSQRRSNSSPPASPERLASLAQGAPLLWATAGDRGPPALSGAEATAAGGGRAVGGIGGLLAGSGGPKLPHVPPAIMPAMIQASQRDFVEVTIIKTLLENYLTIVKKNLADSVPKAVMFFMVNALKDVQSDCVARLYKEELFGSLLREAQDVQSQRVNCHARLKALYHVVAVSEQVRDCVDML